MTKLQIRDRSGNWHDLESGLFYQGGKGYILTYWTEAGSSTYVEKHINRFLQEGTVRETPSFDVLKTGRAA